MNVICPKCQKRVQITDGISGTRVSCPYCRVTLTITPHPQKPPVGQRNGFQEPEQPKGPFLTRPLSDSKKLRTSGQFLHIICPNPKCDYEGPAQRTSKEDTAFGCLLALLFLPAAIIYYILAHGFRYTCPRCGMLVGES